MRPAIAAIALLLTAPCGTGVSGAAERVVGPLREPGPDGQVCVGYPPQQSLPQRPFDRWPGLRVRRLSEDAATGRLAAQAGFPSGWRQADGPSAPQSVEIVKLDGGLQVPWEVHSMIEEGYVMEGDYTLAEGLPTRTVIGQYQAGGYFWRPGGIPRSGPDSGPREGGMWLQRSQVALDVVFYGERADGRASAPVAAAGAPAP